MYNKGRNKGKGNARRSVRMRLDYKNYTGTKVIVPENCFVRQFDEDECAIEDYEVY